jgi:hypothetical protein
MVRLTVDLNGPLEKTIGYGTVADKFVSPSLAKSGFQK